MKRFSQQFKKKADGIRMTARQRADLRDRLTTYMEYHPLPAELKTQKKIPKRTQIGGIVSEPFHVFSINMTYVRSFAGVFAVFLIVGVPIISERAVPGDMLYAVKTEITEELRASLRLSPYSKVEWETKRLERRVAEARLLASEGKLTPETEATVALAVQEHTDAANKEIAAMRETDEDGAAIAEIAFASALEVQSEVLKGHIEKDPDTPQSVEDGHSVAVLADVVNSARDDATVAQAESAPSYEGLLARVESESTRAYELFSSVQNQASPNEILDIERRLADVERKLVKAIVLRSQVDTPELVIIEEDVVIDDTPEPEDTSETEVAEVVETETEIAEEGEAVVEETAVPQEGAPEVEPVEVRTEVQLSSEEREKAAIVLLRAALADIQKLISFMTDIDVRENVSIEELVPVTFTDVERVTEIRNQLNKIASIQFDIDSRVISDELFEKVALGNTLLSERVAITTQMIEEGDVSGAEQNVAEASVIAADILNLVSDLPVAEVIEGEEITEETEVVEEAAEIVSEDNQTSDETVSTEEEIVE
ncbi:MAG: hypothetical protein ACI92I_000158 [Acidimicrobiales bacterium]|jgi:hypothetical protein